MSKKFDALVAKVKAAKTKDQKTLAAWKAANAELTEANAELSAFVSEATATAEPKKEGVE